MLSTDDIVAVTQVLNRVHHLIDQIYSPHSTSVNKGRSELMREVFADDFVYDLSYRGLPVVHGLEQFTALCNASYTRDAKDQMGHQATNIYVYQHEDGTVRADSKVISVYAAGDYRDRGSATCSDFHDVVVRTDAGWRIKERVAVSRYPNPTSYTQSETLEVLDKQLTS